MSNTTTLNLKDMPQAKILGGIIENPTPCIPWLGSIQEAEEFCSSSVGEDNRLISKAKKDFMRRLMKAREDRLNRYLREGIYFE